MSIQSSMTAIANKIRAIRGITGTMGLSTMETNLTTVQTDINNAFTAVGNKKGTVPSSKVSGNLASAINSIPAGVELNYKVVGGTSAPSSPGANTIWVNTSTVGSHVFSATQPTAATNLVWFKTGANSSVVLNALKQNTINVYPVFAKQYVSGAWKNVTAKIWQSSKWITLWTGELYKNGNEYTTYTGGWLGMAKKSSSSSSVGSAVPDITRNTSDITVEAGGSGGGGVFHTANKIDLRGFSKITFNGEFKRAGADNNLVFACWPNLNGTYYTADYGALQKTASTSAVTSIVLDVSAVNSEQYIGIGIVGDSTARITSIVLS